MRALSGYIEKNAVIVKENISIYDGCEVIITVLDGDNDMQEGMALSDDQRKDAALSIAGLWKDHSGGLSVDDEVRLMRRGRRFDI